MKIADIYNCLKSDGGSGSIASRIANGAFWSIFGTAAAKLFVLVAGILCANILGKEGYGQLGIVRSTINLFVVFGTAGMGVTATKYIAQYKNTNREYTQKIASITQGFAFFAGCLTAILVLVSANFLSNHILNAPELTVDIRIGAILLLVTILNGAQNGILTGYEKFQSIAKNTFFASAAEGLFMVVGAKYGGVFGAILGFGLGYICLWLFNRQTINRTFKQYGLSWQWNSITAQDLKILYKFSLPAALSGILVMPAYWIVRTLIIRYNGFGELGIYEAADQWRVIILFIPGVLGQIVLPILSNVLEEGNSKSFWKVIWINIGINAVVTIILSLFILFFGNWLMGLNGKEYLGSTAIIYLAFSTVFSSAATVVGNAITSWERVWTGFAFNLLWASMFIGFSWYNLSSNMASEGVAIALLLSYFLHTLFQLMFLYAVNKRNRST